MQSAFSILLVFPFAQGGSSWDFHPSKVLLCGKHSCRFSILLLRESQPSSGGKRRVMGNSTSTSEGMLQVCHILGLLYMYACHSLYLIFRLMLIPQLSPLKRGVYDFSTSCIVPNLIMSHHSAIPSLEQIVWLNVCVASSRFACP